MALTVYSMGDMPIFTSVLNSVAMVFNSSLFDANQGAGVVVMGFLLALVFMILPALSTGKLDAKPFIFVFILYYGGIVPRERLQVEDVFSGAVTAVDNIPLAIALPASIGASLSKSMTDVVETAFSTTSGSYLTLGAEGFVNPLKMLLSLRDPVMTQRAFPYLSASIIEYIRFCAPTDPNFDPQKLQSSPHVVDYLAGLATAGIMSYYDPLHPQGFTITCDAGGKQLQTDFQPPSVKQRYTAIISTAMAGEFPKMASANSNGATMDGTIQAYNSLTSGILTNLQNAQGFMVNAIALTSVSKGLECINQPAGPDTSRCMSEVMTREALERSNIDASGQAGVFVKTVIPASNMLLALFYGLSPIVLAIAFFSGAQHGLKVLMGFLIFGISMQCWMPIAAIINYMIQMQTQYAFSSFPTSGMTMENYMVFYNILSTKIGLASNLMVTVQSLTFALMSGSMYALSGLSNSMSSKDYMDEGKVAPTVAENKPFMTVGSPLVAKPAYEIESLSGRIGSGQPTQITRPQDNILFSTLKVSAGSGESIQDAQVRDDAATLNFNKASMQALMQTYKTTDGTTDYLKIGQTLSKSNERAFTATKNYVERLTEGMDLSEETRTQLAAKIMVSVGSGESIAGAVVKALSGSELSGEAKTELTAASKKGRNVKLDVQQDASNSNSAINKELTSFAESSGHDLAHTNGTELSNAGGEQYQRADAAAKSAHHQLQAAKVKNSAREAGISMTSKQAAARVPSLEKNQVQLKIEQFIRKQTPEIQNKFNQLLAKKKNLIDRFGEATDENAHLAIYFESLGEVSVEGEDEMWLRLSEVGMTATQNSGTLANDSEYQTRMGTFKSIETDVNLHISDPYDSPASRAERASNVHGPDETLTPATLTRNRQNIERGLVVKTQAPQQSVVPDPTKPNVHSEREARERARRTLVSERPGGTINLAAQAAQELNDDLTQKLTNLFPK